MGASPDGMSLYSLVVNDALSVNFINGSFLSLVTKLFAFSFSRICERNEERKQHKSVCIGSWRLGKYNVHTVHCKKKEKRNDLELYQKFVYHVAQTFLQDFNLADQQFFNIWLSTHPRNFGSDKIVYIYVRTYVWSWGDNLHFKHPAHFGGKSLSLSLDYILTSSTLMQKKKKNTGERGSRRNNKQWRPILLKEKHENFIIIDSQFVLEPTIDTRNFAASFMLISSLADVSNHLRNPLSLQYSSIWLALFTKPSFAWSHCQTQKKRPCHW